MGQHWPGDRQAGSAHARDDLGVLGSPPRAGFCRFPDDRIALLEDQIEPVHLGDAWRALRKARIREALEIEKSIRKRQANDRSPRDLVFHAAAEGCRRAPRIDRPFVAITRDADASCAVDVRDACGREIVAALRTRMLEEGEAIEFVRVLFRELVSDPEVERPGAPPTATDDDSAPRSEDAGDPGVVADWSRSDDAVRSERDAVLEVDDARGWRRRTLEVPRGPRIDVVPTTGKRRSRHSRRRCWSGRRRGSRLRSRDASRQQDERTDQKASSKRPPRTHEESIHAHEVDASR